MTTNKDTDLTFTHIFDADLSDSTFIYFDYLTVFQLEAQPAETTFLTQTYIRFTRQDFLTFADRVAETAKQIRDELNDNKPTTINL